MTEPRKLRNYWSDADRATVLRLHTEKKSYAEIAAAVGRSSFAVRVKLRKLLMTPQQRAMYLATERRRYQSQVPARDVESVGIRPSEAELRDRNMRLMTPPRDLTAAYMGDPLPGRSALERRT